ncbi:MAG: hypothetical protein DLM68_04155 [Hyphomicrobiales bacterium]|nr:MAG: hypothetical protein DLM68_04155 [Hyphomicrobiales bacterium]
MTMAGVRKMVTRIGEAAKFSFSVHPHMLRHACGYTSPMMGRTHALFSTCLIRSIAI